MGRLRRWVVAGSLGLAVAPAHPARAQSLGDLLKGTWTVDGGDCRAGFTLRLGGGVLLWTDAAGHVDTQRVTSRRATGIATRTTASTHGQKLGTVWVYEMLAPGQISLTDGTGRSATLVRCPDMLPGDATPQQIMQAVYTRYAASDEPNLPLSSETNVRAFFVADLADEIVAFASRSGRLPDDCKPADPFVPGAFGDYQVTKVHVDMTPVPPGADHAAGRVSFDNFGTPATVSVALDRTPSGWRIAEIMPAPGQSFRASMAACTAPAK